MSRKIIGHYRQKKIAGISGRGWVSGPTEPKDTAAELTRVERRGSRPKMVTMTSGKRVWMTQGPHGEVHLGV